MTSEVASTSQVDSSIMAVASSTTNDTHQQQANKKRKVVMIPSTSQILSLRAANDIIFRLRCEEDLLVDILLNPIGTNSRVVASQLGQFVVDIVKKYNIYTQRKMTETDEKRGDNVAVSNFLHRKVLEVDIRTIENFFAVMVKNNANDHISRTLRVAAIFVGLIISIEFRTQFLPTPQHMPRFSNQLAESVIGATNKTNSNVSLNNAVTLARAAAAEQKEQLRRDQQRGQKIDPEAFMTFLTYDGVDLMSRLFDGAISLPEFVRLCMERYLIHKPAFIPWIARKYREELSK